MDWQITTYCIGISQTSKCVQVLSETFPKRGMLLQRIRVKKLDKQKEPCALPSLGKTLPLLKQIFYFKHERGMLKWDKHTWAPEKAGLCLSEGKRGQTDAKAGQIPRG